VDHIVPVSQMEFAWLGHNAKDLTRIRPSFSV
jgi:hypothetical protein